MASPRVGSYTNRFSPIKSPSNLGQNEPPKQQPKPVLQPAPKPQKVTPDKNKNSKPAPSTPDLEPAGTSQLAQKATEPLPLCTPADLPESNEFATNDELKKQCVRNKTKIIEKMTPSEIMKNKINFLDLSEM